MNYKQLFTLSMTLCLTTTTLPVNIKEYIKHLRADHTEQHQGKAKHSHEEQLTILRTQQHFHQKTSHASLAGLTVYLGRTLFGQLAQGKSVGELFPFKHKLLTLGLISCAGAGMICSKKANDTADDLRNKKNNAEEATKEAAAIIAQSIELAKQFHQARKSKSNIAPSLAPLIRLAELSENNRELYKTFQLIKTLIARYAHDTHQPIAGWTGNMFKELYDFCAQHHSSFFTDDQIQQLYAAEIQIITEQIEQ